MMNPSRPANYNEIDIEWLTSLEEVIKLEKEWLDLEASVKDRTVFSMYDWVIPWYLHYGSIYGSPLVGIARRHGQLIGIAPFVSWSRNGTLAGVPVRRIDFAGSNSGAGEFLILDNEPEVIGYFLNSLITSGKFDLFCLNGFDINSHKFQILKESIADKSFRSELTSNNYATVDIKNGYENYYNDMGSKFRNTLKRYSKRMTERGKINVDRLNFSNVHSADISNYLSRIFHIADSSLKAKTKGPMADCHRNFYNEIVMRFADSSMIDLSILSIDNKDAAFILAIVENGVYYDVTISYDEEYKDLFPGFYLMQQVLREISLLGIHTVVSHGDYEYKKNWATSFVPRSRVFIFPRSIKAYLSHFAKFRLLPALSDIRESRRGR